MRQEFVVQSHFIFKFDGTVKFFMSNTKPGRQCLFSSLQIEWRDPWLALLLTFHVAVTMTALMTRNHANFQILLFLVLRESMMVTKIAKK